MIVLLLIITAIVGALVYWRHRVVKQREQVVNAKTTKNKNEKGKALLAKK